MKQIQNEQDMKEEEEDEDGEGTSKDVRENELGGIDKPHEAEFFENDQDNDQNDN